MLQQQLDEARANANQLKSMLDVKESDIESLKGKHHEEISSKGKDIADWKSKVFHASKVQETTDQQVTYLNSELSDLKTQLSHALAKRFTSKQEATDAFSESLLNRQKHTPPRKILDTLNEEQKELFFKISLLTVQVNNYEQYPLVIDVSLFLLNPFID